MCVCVCVRACVYVCVCVCVCVHLVCVVCLTGRGLHVAADIGEERRSVPEAHDGQESQLCGTIGYLS